MVFSTGRGSPVGFPVCPVIKITGNPDTYLRMKNDIDINAGSIIEGRATIEEVGSLTFQLLRRVCNGSRPRAEKNDYSEIGILKTEVTL